MSRDLAQLHDAIRPLAVQFLADARDAGIDLIVTCTSRTLEEQTALYAQGRTLPGRIVTNAQAGQSAHNFGLALDVVPIVNGKCDWEGTDLVWQQIGAMGQARGLQWLGAPDSTFHELAHFQLPGWRNHL
jgi:peptidoglycan L-alanyl-D-glutamate endopeptidase CwlK